MHTRSSMIARIAPILTALSLSALARPSRADVADAVVQVPVNALLNARPVSTLTGGVVVPWSVGLDNSDGFITTAANTFLRQPGPALPDDGIFAADSSRPEITLHFSNSAAATAAQARIVTGLGNFEISVPLAKYSKLYLIVASSIGDSHLALTLSYADGTSTPLDITLPDWGTGKPLPTDPPIFFNLIAGLHKWNQQNMSVDTPTHAITGVELSPDVSKQLNRVRLEKLSAPQTLAFWGATGLATSAPDIAGGGGVSGEGGFATGGGGVSGESGSATGGVAGAAVSAAGAGGSSGALASAGSDALVGASGALAGGAAGISGASGRANGSAGASVITVPTNGSSGACSFQVRRPNLDQRGLGWLFALCVVAARRQTRQSKRR